MYALLRVLVWILANGSVQHNLWNEKWISKERRFSHKHQRSTITSKRLTECLGCWPSGVSLFFFFFFFLFLLLFFSFPLFFSSPFHDDCYSQHDSVVPSHSPILPVQVLLCRLYTRGPSDRAHIRCRPDAAVLLLLLVLKYFSLFIFTFSLPSFPFSSSIWLPYYYFHFQPLSPYILPLSFPSSFTWVIWK